MVEIIQCFARRQEEVRDIVCYEHRQPNPREVVAIAHTNERQGDDMVHYKLFKVLTRLLQLQKENDALLQPVSRLKEVISLKVGGVGAVRVELVVSSAVEVPDRGVVHDVESEGAEDTEVDRSVRLLHETRDFRFLREIVVEGDWPEKLLHEEFARETEKEGVEEDKDEIKAALSIVGESGCVRGGVGRKRVGEKDAGVERV